MTNSKSVQTGLFSLSLLLTTVTYGKDGDQQQPVDAQQKGVTTAAQVLTKSAVTAVMADSVMQSYSSADSIAQLQELYKSELANAPKVTLNSKAVNFVKKYLEENRETLEKVEQRSGAYFNTIATIFRQYGIPDELKYLAVIESKLKPSATSYAGAAGLWQLMPGTARSLGLKVSGKNDERRHFYKSTVAAAKYLKALYKEYDDWLLVLAAYNAGAGNINKAIRRSGSRNFWILQDFLPGETKAHVKRFIGAHYYFEEQGSVATLTKTEWQAHQKAITNFMAHRKKEREELEHIMATNKEALIEEAVKEAGSLIKESKSK